MDQLTLERQTSQDSSPDLLLGNDGANTSSNFPETSNEINSAKVNNGSPGMLGGGEHTQKNRIKSFEGGKIKINARKIRRRMCNQLPVPKKWRIPLYSDIQHLEYDFTRGWPPVLISPVQEQEQDELEAQLGFLSVTEPTVPTQSEIKKNRLERLRRLRKSHLSPSEKCMDE